MAEAYAGHLNLGKIETASLGCKGSEICANIASILSENDICVEEYDYKPGSKANNRIKTEVQIIIEQDQIKKALSLVRDAYEIDRKISWRFPFSKRENSLSIPLEGSKSLVVKFTTPEQIKKKVS